MSRSELSEILAHHAKKYPEMQPTDAVKLIYQNEFGGGHLISDGESCRAYLISEYKSQTQSECPLYEYIGNGIVRVNLSALDKYRITPESLSNIFIRSSNEHKGNINTFKEKLKVLYEECERDIFSFTPNELSAYLREYEKASFPAVSHSGKYREAYHPSYRIVLKKYLDKECKST